MLSQRKPVKLLEEQCNKARESNLIEEYICNPFTARPYMMIRFHTGTDQCKKELVAAYVRTNFDVDSAEFIAENNVLYIVYDFWKRFPETY